MVDVAECDSYPERRKKAVEESFDRFKALELGPGFDFATLSVRLKRY